MDEKDMKTLAFEQELVDLMEKYGYISRGIRPVFMTISVSTESKPAISITGVSK